MKLINNVYAIPLDFQFGFVIAEVMDYTEFNSFDGVVLKVYDMFLSTKKEVQDLKIEEILTDQVIFGPAPLNKFPNVKGKGAWILIGKRIVENREKIWFKDLRGLLFKNNDWSKLSPWFKIEWYNDDSEQVEEDYEKVRNLETSILNHVNSIPVLINMWKLILNKELVNEYYDLNDPGFKNLFIKLVNTYYSKDKAVKLLELI